MMMCFYGSLSLETLGANMEEMIKLSERSQLEYLLPIVQVATCNILEIIFFCLKLNNYLSYFHPSYENVLRMYEIYEKKKKLVHISHKILILAHSFKCLFFRWALSLVFILFSLMADMPSLKL
jgi:hypothetical protein